ncbi:MAG: DUF951 domain-containing protein [Clostridia bacterium]|nr:DUF951 domain-containing protein [Clostridia bacterium]
MKFTVGDKIKSKKPHACGGREWEIIRTGADVKLKCLTCGRVIFVSVPDAEKMIAVYYGKGESDAG